jgi:hypothetical protein
MSPLPNQFNSKSTMKNLTLTLVCALAGALNLIWQPFKFERLNVGLEGLYGVNEVKNGDTGDDWRVQVGIIYSLF